MRALLSFIVSTTSFGSSLLAGVAAAAEPFNWSPQVNDPIHTPAELVESMHSAFGYNHCRAVHAKGIILQGEFTPDTHAKEITKAPHLQGPSSKVTVRFSDFSGVPTIPDNDVEPGNADRISFFYGRDALTDGSHVTRAFVTRDEGQLWFDRPIAIGRMNVSVAHSASYDFYQDLAFARFRHRNVFNRKWFSKFVNNGSFHIGNAFQSFALCIARLRIASGCRLRKSCLQTSIPLGLG